MIKSFLIKFLIFLIHCTVNLAIQVCIMIFMVFHDYSWTVYLIGIVAAICGICLDTLVCQLFIKKARLVIKIPFILHGTDLLLMVVPCCLAIYCFPTSLLDRNDFYIALEIIEILAIEACIVLGRSILMQKKQFFRSMDDEWLCKLERITYPTGRISLWNHPWERKKEPQDGQSFYGMVKPDGFCIALYRKGERYFNPVFRGRITGEKPESLIKVRVKNAPIINFANGMLPVVAFAVIKILDNFEWDSLAFPIVIVCIPVLFYVGINIASTREKRKAGQESKTIFQQIGLRESAE